MDACAGNVTDVCKIGQELLMSVRNFSQCAVYQLIEILDSCKICLGNPDADLVQQWNSFSPTLHSSEGI